MGWDQLKQIKDSVNTKPEERQTCPYDGTRLEKHPRTGDLHCPFCGLIFRR